MRLFGYVEMSNFMKVCKLLRKYTHLLPFYGGLIVIILTTLYPFDFQIRSLTVNGYLDGYSMSAGSYYSDIPLNIVLFFPYGFGLTAILGNRKNKISRREFLLILLAGFTLTFAVEFLQLFLPNRTSTVSDMLSNMLGTIIGFLAFKFWENRTLVWAKNKPVLLNTKILLVSFSLYLTTLCLSAYLIKGGFQLNGWQPNYYLVLGNEKTQDRPWMGIIKNLAVFDCALSADEIGNLFMDNDKPMLQENLVAYYPLTDGFSLSDVTGNLSNLHWKGVPQNLTENSVSYQLDGKHWLESESPVTFLNQSLINSSEFTLSLIVGSRDASQYGPARILSIGADPFQQNLIIGQEGVDLVIRIRTPLTGNSGTVPEWKIADFFANSNLNHLVIRYDGISVQVFANNGQNVSKINVVPGAILYVLFFSPNAVYVDSLTAKLLAITFYFFTLMPLSILLAILVAKTIRRSHKLLLLVIGTIIPPLLLETIFSASSDIDLRLFNLLTSIFIIFLIYGCIRIIDFRTQLLNHFLA